MTEYKISEKHTVFANDIKCIDKIRNILLINQEKYHKFIHPAWNNFIIDNELNLFLDYLKNTNKMLKILEIGAGNGYCSYSLEKKGFKNIIATDIEPRFPCFFDVEKSNVEKLPFKNNEFDIIISMNVLEHINDIDIALCEMNRVLKPNGLMLHTMPTPSLNITTIILLPLAYFRNIFYLFSGYWIKKFYPMKNRNILRFIKFLLTLLNPINIFYFGGHGAHGMVACNFYWTSIYWRRKFKENDFSLIEVKKMELFLSLLKLFPFKFIKFRKILGKYFPPVKLYVLKKDYK